MFKATLEYDIDELEGQEAFRRANSALDLVLALREIEEELRKIAKYDTGAVFDREKFYSILNDFNIQLDRLVS